jgi:hypothetical protein
MAVITNKSISSWLNADKKLKKAMQNKDVAFEKAYKAPLPKHLRKATYEDIVSGAIIWYPRFANDSYSENWKYVDEVLSPQDAFKAYYAHDGCRYGLDGAYVEFKPEGLTQKILKDEIFYNPETGEFFRNKDGYQNIFKKGDVAGGVVIRGNKKYWTICIGKKIYYGHRLAWLYMTGEFPKSQVDHIDGNGLNNKYENLRDVSHAENAQNRKLDPRNKSGKNAVSFCKQTKKWGVNMTINGKKIWLGRHKNKSHAEFISHAAKLWFGFHKNHGEV